ncbi:MAG: CpsD/CapB family tyrosine-protein kinase, partial [Ignavibacteria bacterium]|nr:CpsD/CapB family tyrosine-protein kinase [Ignavibacteria bacterium]
MTVSEDFPEPQEEQTYEEKRESLIPLARPILLNPEEGKRVDPSYISPRFYNSFNYALLAQNHAGGNFTVGVTSTSEGEGKTLVAANLAVSLAISNAKETLLVDFHLQKPHVHSIFGTLQSPGVTEAMSNPAIHVSLTKIKHLYVLSAGASGNIPFLDVSSSNGTDSNAHSTSSLSDIARFRDIIYSLKREFDFVIIDMPSILDPNVPLLLASQMDGFLIVVDTRRTTQEKLDSAM